MSSRKKGVFIACKKCKALSEPGTQVCPICGGTEFTEEWSGMVIIIDPENSQIAKILGVSKPGRYAIKLGST